MKKTPRKTPSARAQYPVPGPVGGRLIRKLLAELKQIPELSLALPIRTPVFVAVSGGLDSTALFLLLAKYGRRVVSPGQLRVLHINHGWRAEASDQDQAFVASLAHEFQIPILIHRAQKPTPDSRDSWEDHARQIRQKFFDEQLKADPQAWLLTAHQADDQAETLLWRLFTGTTQTHGAGILRQNSRVLRPLLGIRRKELQAFLEEEARNWRIDQTNGDPRFLRARVRAELLPAIEKIFPRAVAHLLELGRQAQTSVLQPGSDGQASPAVQETLNLFWRSAGLSLRRPHLKSIFMEVESQARDRSRFGPARNWSLPGGWLLRLERKENAERWILERAISSGK